MPLKLTVLQKKPSGLILLLVVLIFLVYVDCLKASENARENNCGRINLLPGAPGKGPQALLSIGDSIQAMWRKKREGPCGSVAGQAALSLGRYIKMKSVWGAYMTYDDRPDNPIGILNQFKAERDTKWQWVIVNGGANDLAAAGCKKRDCLSEISCREKCRTILDGIAHIPSKTGDIFTLIGMIKNESPEAKILLLGYYRLEGVLASLNPFLSIPEGEEDFQSLNSRYQQISEGYKQVYYLDTSRLMTDEQGRRILKNYHEDDIHPSIIGAKVIGNRIAAFIRSHSDWGPQ